MKTISKIAGAAGALTIAVSLAACQTADISGGVNATGKEAGETQAAFIGQHGYTFLRTPVTDLPTSRVFELGENGLVQPPVCGQLYESLTPDENGELWESINISKSEHGGAFLSFMAEFIKAAPQLNFGVKNMASAEISYEGVLGYHLAEDRFAGTPPYHPGCRAMLQRYKETSPDRRERFVFIASAIKADSMKVKIKFNEGATPGSNAASLPSDIEARNVLTPDCGFAAGVSAGTGDFGLKAGLGGCTSGEWNLESTPGEKPYFIAFKGWTMDKLNEVDPQAEVTGPRAGIIGKEYRTEHINAVIKRIRKEKKDAAAASQ